MAKHFVYVLKTPTFRQRFSPFQYGTLKKAKDACHARAVEYVRETGKLATVEKIKAG